VTVENRWVPEDDVGDILAWADAVVLPYREASQSGVAAAALAAGRWVVATRVGGIAEQLGGEALARLCEPDATGVSDAIADLLSKPLAIADAIDATQAWRELAGTLVTTLRSGCLRHASPKSG
jgi:glycosyltransferase involved in cell wall biosynthesis